MVGPPTAAQKAAKDWYVSPAGQVWQATGAEAGLLRVAGWAGPMTYAQATAYSSNATPAPLKAAGDVAGLAGATGEIGDFFHRLTEKETWTRFGEVAVGGLLIYVGLRALTRGSTTVGAGARRDASKPVRKVAKTVTKIAVPEARLASRTVAKRAAPKTTARIASHRARVRKYGAKSRVTARRESHIYHHKGT
jgi:hypothetical protein